MNYEEIENRKKSVERNGRKVTKNDEAKTP